MRCHQPYCGPVTARTRSGAVNTRSALASRMVRAAPAGQAELVSHFPDTG
jgi:hypothetical protein